MGKKVVFEINSPGIIEMLQSSGAQAVCVDAARQIASVAGEGFAVDSEIRGDRVRARVRAVTKSAVRRVYRDNILEKGKGSVSL